MIKLTIKKSGTARYLNPDHIIDVGSQENTEKSTFVSTSSEDCIIVTESPEEVTRKILEYKLAMVSFGSTMLVTMSEKEVNHLTDLADSAVELNDKLFRLAGLGE